MKNQTFASIFAITAVLFWSTAASAFKLSLRYVDIFHLLLYASCASLLVFFIALVAQKKALLLRSCTMKDFARSLGMGFLNPFLYYVVLFKAYSLLPAQQAMTLNYIWPLMLVLLSIPLLEQKISAKSIIAVAVSFAGVIVIATRGDVTSLKFTSLTGVALALGSSVIWGLFWIANVRDRRDETVKLFMNFAFGTPMILLVSLFAAPHSTPSIRGLLGATYVGLFEMGITYIFWLKALSLSRTTAQVGNLIYLSPFLSLLFIRIVVGEPIAVATVIGLALIVSGIVAQRRVA